MQSIILIAEDDKKIAEGLEKFLKKKGHKVLLAHDGRKALDIVKKQNINLLLTDMVLPNMDGISLLKETKNRKPEIECIMVTAHGTIEKAVEALKIGAYDFLIKPVNVKRLGILIEKALEKQVLILKNIELQKKVEERFGFKNIIGKGNEIKRILELVSQVSSRNSNVLIYGESGTGKELIANAIHYSGNLPQSPFIKVNCSVFNEGVLESELFGHEKGSFTGAASQRIGRFEMADGGTLFLDEVSEIPPSIQVKLLRVIQEKEFERVGGSKTIKVDVRIIASANKDLKELVKQEKFREDLYYRLNVVKIDIPPLRNRKEDIPFLLNYFISKFNKQYGTQIKGVTRKTLNLLLNYYWPGNVRELENCIESAMVMAKDEYLTPKDLPEYVTSQSADNTSVVIDIGTPLKEIEKNILTKTLELVKGNKAKAAQLLGIGVKTVHRKFEEYGLKPDRKS